MAEGTEDLDVDVALARLMEAQAAELDEPRVIHRAEAPPDRGDARGEVARLREDLDRVLNLVLDEVEAHTSGVERRLAAMAELVEAQSESAETARRTVGDLDDRLETLARTIEGHVDASQLDLGPLEARLASLADAVTAQARDIEQLRDMIHWMQERLLVDVHFSAIERERP